eukprot:11600508-Alexandrium_andersonii.AAC.1
MGFTHSVALLIVLNMAALRRVIRALQPSLRLVLQNDAEQWAAGCTLRQGVAAAYVHVDDFG